jgi:hypothetical protein
MIACGIPQLQWRRRRRTAPGSGCRPSYFFWAIKYFTILILPVTRVTTGPLPEGAILHNHGHVMQLCSRRHRSCHVATIACLLSIMARARRGFHGEEQLCVRDAADPEPIAGTCEDVLGGRTWQVQEQKSRDGSLIMYNQVYPHHYVRVRLHGYTGIVPM